MDGSGNRSFEEEWVINMKEFIEFLQSLANCCLKHPTDFDPNDIAEVIHGPNYSQDSTEYSMYKTLNGKVGVVIDSSDYTGHG